MIAKKTNLFSKPINGKYLIRLKLKSGGFGSVYIAKDIQNPKKQYAIKLMPIKVKKYAQIQEMMYKKIQQNKYTHGFIKDYEFGSFQEYYFIVMELIGQDLDDLLHKTKAGRFSVKSAMMIGLQAIDRLEALHKIGYIHRDVKPDNFAIGLKQKNKVVYLFDFGLAKKIGTEIPSQQKGKAIGTLAFMSMRCHEGKDQNPSDDIESLIYSLLYLMEGTLPWMKLNIQSSADYHKIYTMKKSLHKSQFKNQEIPKEIFELFHYLRGSSTPEKPDYLKLKYKIIEVLKSIKEENDFMFDWCTNRSVSKRKIQSPLKGQKDDDSPRRNRKIEKMKEQNQNIVQNQIYEVYKFIGEPKKQKQTSKKLIQKKMEVKEEIKIPIKPKQKMMRPNSAKPIQKIPIEQLNLFQRMKQIQSLQFQGPKITINKTAKHKI